MARAPLYNIYRPQAWSDVIEQDAIKQILNEELQSGTLKHVLLFTGPAGCGKTTSGRIFANTIEPTKGNIIEINCADHTGVDDVRQLVLDVSRTKPLAGTYKVFILDEVHMLTTQSQNALLKIFEEPPAHCIYIMCTTDPQKILSTILSRSFRYDFSLISQQGIISRLQYILEQEKALGEDGCGVQSWEPSALELIAQSAGGHMRNAVATLEKVVSYSKTFTVNDVTSVLGVTNYNTLFDILDSILTKNDGNLIGQLETLNASGMDLKLFIKNFLQFVLDINKYVILKSETGTGSVTTIPPSFENRLQVYNVAHRPALKNLMKTMLELNSSIRWETNVKPVLETNLLLEVL